jgi:carbamoyltransferase
MVILGIHCGHNASAALMRDGVVVAAAQEERFSKRKNQVAFPAQAIRFLAQTHLGGNFGRIDRVALAGRLVDPTGLAVGRYSAFSVADHIRENHLYWRKVFYEGAPNDGSYWREMFERGENLNYDHNVDVAKMMAMSLPDAFDYISKTGRQEAMKAAFGWDGAYDFIDHHACHAHYAFRGQEVPADAWDDVLILTADARGDNWDWSASSVDRSGTVSNIAGGFEMSVARIYRFVTLILGMKPNEHEYKLMGLSSYSKSASHIRETEKVFFELLDFRNGAFASDRPLKDNYFDLKERLEGHRFDNVAAAVQNWASAVTRAWIAHWVARTGRRYLCFAGGLSMNIKMNGNIVRMPELKGFYVPASGGDETNSIGACYASAQMNALASTSLAHVYLCPMSERPEDADWRVGIANAHASPDDYAVADGVDADGLASLLAAGHVVARCVGPMEFGARALGNRSILADPSRPEIVKTINDSIKNRDFWMPFTPSILVERVRDYLVFPKENIDSPYMTIGFESTALARKEIPAGLHSGDHSARPQFVSRDRNLAYWALISAFEKRTGIGALLNTSLNLHGDPMNSTVADAARTLALSDLDFLALPDDRLLYKRRSTHLLSVLQAR